MQGKNYFGYQQIHDRIRGEDSYKGDLPCHGEVGSLNSWLGSLKHLSSSKKFLYKQQEQKLLAELEQSRNQEQQELLQQQYHIKVNYLKKNLQEQSQEYHRQQKQLSSPQVIPLSKLGQKAEPKKPQASQAEEQGVQKLQKSNGLNIYKNGSIKNIFNRNRRNGGSLNGFINTNSDHKTSRNGNSFNGYINTNSDYKTTRNFNSNSYSNTYSSSQQQDKLGGQECLFRKGIQVTKISKPVHKPPHVSANLTPTSGSPNTDDKIYEKQQNKAVQQIQVIPVKDPKRDHSEPQKQVFSAKNTNLQDKGYEGCHKSQDLEQQRYVPVNLIKEKGNNKTALSQLPPQLHKVDVHKKGVYYSSNQEDESGTMTGHVNASEDMPRDKHQPTLMDLCNGVQKDLPEASRLDYTTHEQVLRKPEHQESQNEEFFNAMDHGGIQKLNGHQLVDHKAPAVILVILMSFMVLYYQMLI